MSQATLFVCAGCGFTPEQQEQDGITGGNYLLKEVWKLYNDWSRREELKIESVGCLCICERPCACAIASPTKPTFLFVDIPPLESASAILDMSTLYLDSDNGYFPRYKLPELLQTRRLARIPPLDNTIS